MINNTNPNPFNKTYKVLGNNFLFINSSSIQLVFKGESIYDETVEIKYLENGQEKTIIGITQFAKISDKFTLLISCNNTVNKFVVINSEDFSSIELKGEVVEYKLVKL